MNKRNTLRRMLALLCCMAMLLPCVPATLAADEALFSTDFESFASDDELGAAWKKGGTTTIGKPVLSTDMAHSGTKSMLLEDTEADQSFQVAHSVKTTLPVDTEVIVTAWYYAESADPGSSTMPRLNVYNNSSTFFDTYSTGKWDRISGIVSTYGDNQMINVVLVNNKATTAKVYWDDITVNVLTPELAAEYINEKISMPVPVNADVILGLKSKALGITSSIQDAKAKTYIDALKAARTEKGADLTADDIILCINNMRLDELKAIYEGGTVAVGATGEIVPNMELPAGITAQWASVSPAGKAVTVADGKATATSLPGGEEDDVYSAVLRLSTATKSVDINYNIRLKSAASFDKELLNKAKAELVSNPVIGAAKTGTIAAPTVKEAGVTTKWARVESNPGDCLAVTNGQLTVKALPTGLEYYEAVAVLQLVKGNSVVEMEYSIVVYDSDYRTLLHVSNSGFEDVDIEGKAVDWKSLGEKPDCYTEVVSTEAKTGENSFHFVDSDPAANYGWRSKATDSPAKEGIEYELSFWVKGTTESPDANRIGVGDYMEWQNASGNKKGQTEGLPTAANTEGWTLVKQRGVGIATTAYVSHMPYSFVSTTVDVYMDDFRTWELTTKGSELSFDDLLVNGTAWDFKTFDDLIYIYLGTKGFGVSATLNPDNKAKYVKELTNARNNKGSMLTAAEIAEAVNKVDNEDIAASRAALADLAAQLPKNLTISQVGVIELPITIEDEEISLAYDKVVGVGASRIRLTGMGAKVDSLPAYGKQTENATLTLTLTKGSAVRTAEIKLVLKAFTKNMSEMAEAAKTIDITDCLNGQPANNITADLKTLPTDLGDGITVSWQALDSATLQPSSAVTADGKVTRPAYGEADAAVVLRATLTKGSEEYNYDLYLIVAAQGVEEARDVLTNNVDFEAPAPADDRGDPQGWIKGIKWEDGRASLWTSYAVVSDTAFTGKQGMRITAGAKQWNSSKAAMTDFNAILMNSAVTTAREGYTYTLDAMVNCESADITPAVILRFYGNFGERIASYTADYATAPGNLGNWKNLHVSAMAPAGTIMVTAELDGGTKDGITFYDDVRLREWAPVANGSFELGTTGWTTEGTVADGKLTLAAGQTAVSVVRPADRGVTYFLSLDADGGKAALRFVDKDGATLAEYSNDAAKAFFAYAPANTAGVQVVLTGAMTADNVKITRSVTGTGVTDGDFEISANAGVGTPWDLTDAEIAPNTGKTGAGLTVKEGGEAKSTVFPVEDGKGYEISVDVKGKGAALQLNVYNYTKNLGIKKQVVSESDGWTTLTISYDELTGYLNPTNPEAAYGQLILTGAAVFDNVKVYSTSKSVSNYSMEDTKILPYGTFPFNWSGYGFTANYVNNQNGQYTEGVKSLAVDLFGIGEGGVRSSMLKDIKGGKAYEATAYAKGSGAKLFVEFWDKDLNKLGSEFVTIDSADWKEYSVIGTAPAGTVYASLSLGGNGVGSAQIDEANIFPVVRAIGNNAQTFIDNWFIADSQNVKRTFHEGKKVETSVLLGAYVSEPIWDAKDGIWKLWHRDGNKLKYRTSTDAITWSNTVKCYNAATGEEMQVGGYVMIDEDEPDLNKRYKGIFWNAQQSRTEGSYDYWSSPDGINWTYEVKGPIGQDVHTLTYDPHNDEYILTYKISSSTPGGSETIRTHSIATSKDMINWTAGVRQYTVGTPMDTVEMDMVRTDGYGNGMYAIGDSYVSLNWRMLLYENESFGGVIDNNLLFSRDLTEDWQRLRGDDGTAFVAVSLSETGTFKDIGQVYTAGGPTKMGDELWWMYYGLSRHHGYNGSPNWNGGYIGYAKWRMNGFASMDFSKGGTLTTEQFTMMGTELHVNAVGNLTVDLLDAKGNLVATGKFSGDSVDGVVTWDKSIADQAGKVVSLRITSSDAKLYTIQFVGSIFDDVADDAWYSRAVHYAVDNGIMGGYGAGKFGPNDTLSRAMVVQMLYNKVGQPAISGKHGFNDVPADQWFNNAVTWGTKNGVMGGYGDGKFGPNDSVTIEQIAVILWNYSGNPEFDAKLGDVGSYSGWAQNGLTWARDNGILHGVNFVNATDNATRAQAAQMLTNFLRG